jgi:hypothetical protein
MLLQLADKLDFDRTFPAGFVIPELGCDHLFGQFMKAGCEPRLNDGIAEQALSRQTTIDLIGRALRGRA